MSPEFQSVFARLRDILKAHAGGLTVGRDTADHYSLEAPAGPATLRAWGGKVKSQTIPIAWVQVGKSYVSYHLMGIYGNPKLLDGYSKELKARMQGKSCFNFKTVDESLFEELERLTIKSITGMRKAGYTSE
jgi:hypothetical protein